MKKVTFIVPIYNAEKYLYNCLESIRNQTLKEIEVILINDGSRDESLRICNEFCKKDNRFKLINKGNSGVSDSRNIGIKTAQAEYLMFVDADDWLEPEAAEICYENIKKFNVDICQFNYFFNYENGKQIKGETFGKKLIKKTYKDRTFLQCNVIAYKYVKVKKREDYIGRIRGCWSKMFSTKFIKKNNLFFDTDLEIQEDTCFYVKALEKMKKMIIIDANLYHYRQNKDSVTRSFDSKKWEKCVKVLEKIQNFWKETEKNNDIEQCIYILAFELLVEYIKHDIFNFNKDCKYKEKKKKLKEVINSPTYVEVIINLKYKYLIKSQKIIYFLLKRKFYRIIYLLNYIKDKTN